MAERDSVICSEAFYQIFYSISEGAGALEAREREMARAREREMARARERESERERELCDEALSDRDFR